MTPEQRVAELERLYRRLVRIGSTIVAVIVAVAMLCAGLILTNRARAQATPQPEAVVGSEFRLVDALGATRASLALEENEPRLRFYDAQGRVRASLILQRGSPRLVLAGEQGGPAASLGVGENGSALALGNEGRLRAIMSVDEKDNPKLVFRDSTGKPFWSAP